MSGGRRHDEGRAQAVRAEERLQALQAEIAHLHPVEVALWIMKLQGALREVDRLEIQGPRAISVHEYALAVTAMTRRWARDPDYGVGRAGDPCASDADPL